MEIKDLSDKTGEWLRGTGKESDIVISSRIRLARNIVGFPFLSRSNLKQRREIESLLKKTIVESNITKDISYVNLNNATSVDKLLLVERHLISKEHAEGEGDRGVAFGKSETISLMINEEDHLRVQVIRSGFELSNTWETTDEIDNILGKTLNFAFSARFLVLLSQVSIPLYRILFLTQISKPTSMRASIVSPSITLSNFPL